MWASWLTAAWNTSKNFSFFLFIFRQSDIIAIDWKYYGGGVVGCGQPDGHDGGAVVCGHPPHGWGTKQAWHAGAVGGKVGGVWGWHGRQGTGCGGLGQKAGHGAGVVVCGHDGHGCGWKHTAHIWKPWPVHFDI